MELANQSNSQIKLENLISFILSDELCTDKLLEHINSCLDDNWLSVSVATSQKIVVSVAKGVRTLEEQQAVNTKTLYNTASVTKFIMVNILCALIDQNKLSVNDKLIAHIDIDIPNKDSLTIEHLLTHTSGLVDNINFYAPDQPIDNILARNNCILPGIKFIYANVNYVLLAMIFEKVCNCSLDQVIERFLSKPLGLNRTVLIESASSNDNCAIGYKHIKQINKSVPASNFFIWGGSNIRSTPTDLVCIINHFFNDEQYISCKTRNRVLESIKPIHFQYFDQNGKLCSIPVNMGYGIEQQSFDVNGRSIDIYCASGWQDSNIAYVGYEPGSKKAFAICCTKVEGESPC